jgi:hypothetical protein
MSSGKRARMPRPDSVKVGPYVYELSWDKNLTDLGAGGMTNPDNQIIGVDPTLGGGMQRSTLVHEILHAIWKQTPLHMDYADEDKDSDGEKIIRTLEPLVFQVILENPEVVKWLRS